MRIDKSILAIGLTLWLSLFVGPAVAQHQPQAAPKSEPKTRPKATSPDSAKAPAVSTPAPLPARAISHEFKVLSIDLLSGLDSLASAEMKGDLIYEPRLAEVEKLMNRAKYLAENDMERALDPIAGLYLAQIVVCRIAVQMAENKSHLGAQMARGLGLGGTSIERQELLGQQEFSKDLEKNASKCAEEHKEARGPIESFIVRSSSGSNQPDKEEPLEIKR